MPLPRPLPDLSRSGMDDQDDVDGVLPRRTYGPSPPPSRDPHGITDANRAGRRTRVGPCENDRPARAYHRTREAAAYTIPTDRPESDGTYSWDRTTPIVELAAGTFAGLGYGYATPPPPISRRASWLPRSSAPTRGTSRAPGTRWSARSGIEAARQDVADALRIPGPVLIEAVVDPLEPPMPANVTFDQAKHFAESLARGERDRVAIAREAIGERIRELV